MMMAPCRVPVGVVLLCWTLRALADAGTEDALETEEPAAETISSLTSTLTPALCPERCACGESAARQRVVNCSARQLVAFPVDSVPMDVGVLDLSHNLLKTVPRDLPAWTQLEVLILANNALADFPPRALRDFSALQVLDLSNNLIVSLRHLKPDRFVVENPVLQVLNLSGNGLQDLGHGSFTSLASSSLQELDLSHCAVSSINGEEALRELPSLRLLHLRANPLVSLPAGLQAPSLHQLDASSCRLRAVPRGFLSSLPHLAHLILSDNPDLEVFDAPEGAAAWAPSLRYLRASGCAIQDISFLATLPNLTHVEMRANRIGRLHPLTLQDNGPLLYLDLADNNLNELPANAFDGPLLLKEVDISGNKVTSIHQDTFALHGALRQLNVSRNPLSTLLLNAPGLRVLDASHGELAQVADKLLDTLPQLRHLNLSNNPLPRLPARLTSSGNEAALYTLDLSFCRLTDMPLEVLSGLPLLQTIDLRGNRLTEPLKVEAFIKNEVVHQIRLGDNPWRCDCKDTDFLDLISFLQMHPMKDDTAKVTCHSPETLVGQTWHEVCQRPADQKPSSEMEGWVFLIILGLCVVAVTVTVILVRRLLDRKGRVPGADPEGDAGAELEEAEQCRQLRAHERRMQQQQQDELRRQRMRPLSGSNYETVLGLSAYDPPSYEEAVLMDRMTQEDPEDQDQAVDDFQTELYNKAMRVGWSSDRRDDVIEEETEDEESDTDSRSAAVRPPVSDSSNGHVRSPT